MASVSAGGDAQRATVAPVGAAAVKVNHGAPHAQSISPVHRAPCQMDGWPDARIRGWVAQNMVRTTYPSEWALALPAQFGRRPPSPSGGARALPAEFARRPPSAAAAFAERLRRVVYDYTGGGFRVAYTRGAPGERTVFVVAGRMPGGTH